MKKDVLRFLALLCCFAVALTLPALTTARAEVNNVIVGSTPSYSSSGKNAGSTPSASDIWAADNCDQVQFPAGNSYYSHYRICYIDASGGHSVYVYSKPSTSAKKREAFHGSRVTAIAKENGLTCILYYTDQNVYRAGWVTSTNLSDSYPGKTFSIGAGSLPSNAYNAGDPAVSWSEEFFYGTKQKFTELDTPIKDCVGFTLDYQVTARNGASTGDVLGSRTVYVNDGSGWVAVGSFKYSALGPVHVEVTLDSPMTLAAVATSADCAAPNTFHFRQSVLDVYCK